MKKKPLTYHRIRDFIIYIVAIYCCIVFIQTTYENLHKKYVLRHDGVTVRGRYCYSKKVHKVRISFTIYFYQFKVGEKEYIISSRQGFPDGTDSVDIVILPDNPDFNAIKRWVDQSWLIPPYWP